MFSALPATMLEAVDRLRHAAWIFPREIGQLRNHPQHADGGRRCHRVGVDVEAESARR